MSWARAVLSEVDELLATWPTREVAGAAWEAHGQVAVVEDLDAAMALSDEIAPEHLEVQVAEDRLDEYLAGLRNYGSLFLGERGHRRLRRQGRRHQPRAAHERAARYTGGLWVGKFLKTCTYQRLTEEGTRRIAPAVAAISLAERFEGHALTATMRLDRLGHRDPA